MYSWLANKRFPKNYQQQKYYNLVLVQINNIFSGLFSSFSMHYRIVYFAVSGALNSLSSCFPQIKKKSFHCITAKMKINFSTARKIFQNEYKDEEEETVVEQERKKTMFILKLIDMHFDRWIEYICFTE